MATITKPMALDESFNTTETTPRNQADVLAAIEAAIRQGFGQVASGVEYDNTDSGLTADNVQDAIDEVDDTVDGLVDDVTEISSDIESTKTATGNPLALTDAAPINAESLVVEFSPKQDLHGQSAPYVGGAGKNKFGTSLIWSLQNSANNDGVISNTTADNRDVFFFVVYVISGDTIVASTAETKVVSENGRCYQTITIPNGSNPDTIRILHTGGAADIGLYATFRETGTYTVSLNLLGHNPSVVGGLSFRDIQIEEGSTMTSFAPYSNICPITGYDECNVDDVGVNQWDEEWRNGYYDASGLFNADANYLATKNPIPVKGNKTSYFYCNSGNFGRIVWTDIDGNFISTDVIQNKNFTRTSPNNAMYLQFDMVGAYGNVYKHDISINYPSTVTTYQPYHSSNATIQFGQTVYGGRSNFTDGGTDDEFENVDFGDLSWTYRGDGLFSADLSDYAFESDVMAYCSGYRYMGTVDGASMATSNGSVYLYYNDGQSSRVIYVVDTQYTDAIVFKAAVTGIQFVYEKATPTQLSTPPTDLKLLKGTNNITTNGTTINLGYQPDNVIGVVKEKADKINFSEIVKYTISGNTADLIPLVIDGTAHNNIPIVTDITKYRMLCVELVLKPSTAITGVYFSAIAFTDGIYLPSGISIPVYIPAGMFYANVTINPDGNGGFKLSYVAVNQSQSTPPDYYSIRVRAFNQY